MLHNTQTSKGFKKSMMEKKVRENSRKGMPKNSSNKVYRSNGKVDLHDYTQFGM
jgi:hypothetical protein